MILVNGDSFTFGDGLEVGEPPWPNILFPQCDNIAESGSSNASISRRTIAQCLMYPEKYTKVLVAWSAGLYRLELGDSQGHPNTILLTSRSQTTLVKELINNWTHQIWYLGQFLHYLNYTRLALADQGISFQCVHFSKDLSMLFSVLTDYNQFKKLIDINFWGDTYIRKEYLQLRRLYDNNLHCWMGNPTMNLGSVVGTNVISDSDPHPTVAGHYDIAEFLNHSLTTSTKYTNNWSKSFAKAHP